MWNNFGITLVYRLLPIDTYIFHKVFLLNNRFACTVKYILTILCYTKDLFLFFFNMKVYFVKGFQRIFYEITVPVDNMCGKHIPNISSKVDGICKKATDHSPNNYNTLLEK